ncbi:MAG TPA: IS66 family transposase [Actinomycetes bacterium]|nr:IS66 family transposase [Actinomycetes bacterium]
MDDPLDLYHTSRAELAELILAQRDRIADLEREVGRQEEELATLRAVVAQMNERVGALLGATEAPAASDDRSGSPGMPGLKARQAPGRPARSRRRRDHGYGRSRMVPTHRQIHAYSRCPRCRVALGGGTVVRTREVIEVPRVPVVVTEHVYLERRCPACRQRWVPGPGLMGEVVGQGRLGLGLLSLIVTLREELRLPVERIQWYLRTLHGLALSVGAIVGACATVAAQAAPLVARIRGDIRASPVVHADETGWRQDGRNGYAWTVSTPTQRAFLHGGRDKRMLTDLLGDGFAGVLVSDFYGVYTSYDGRHQYCWAHLLREVHDLTTAHPQAAGMRGWADAVVQLYQRARAFADPEPATRRRAQRGFERELRALCVPYLDTTRPPAKLCRRITTHLADLFGFVADPTIPATNNAAERSLRHLVTCRKISGGTRSAGGTATKMALATLFGTWRLQGRNPLDQCRQLLISPQV